MKLKEAVSRAREELQAVTSLEVSNIIGISRYEEGWRVNVELIERKAIPNSHDLLGVYEVLLDDEGSLVRYERKRVRRRADLEEEIE